MNIKLNNCLISEYFLCYKLLPVEKTFGANIKQGASLPSAGQRNHDIVEEIQEENFDKYHVD